MTKCCPVRYLPAHKVSLQTSGVWYKTLKCKNLSLQARCACGSSPGCFPVIWQEIYKVGENETTFFPHRPCLFLQPYTLYIFKQTKPADQLSSRKPDLRRYTFEEQHRVNPMVCLWVYKILSLCSWASKGYMKQLHSLLIKRWLTPLINTPMHNAARSKKKISNADFSSFNARVVEGLMWFKERLPDCLTRTD